MTNTLPRISFWQKRYYIRSFLTHTSILCSLHKSEDAFREPKWSSRSMAFSPGHCQVLLWWYMTQLTFFFFSTWTNIHTNMHAYNSLSQYIQAYTRNNSHFFINAYNSWGYKDLWRSCGPTHQVKTGWATGSWAQLGSEYLKIESPQPFSPSAF